MTTHSILSKSPLIDTIVELRFESPLPTQVLAGLLFNKLTQYGYGGFEELPITHLPPEIRDQDENLKFSVHYRMKSDKYLVSVGQRAIVIACLCIDGSDYQGWDNYKGEIEKVLDDFKEISNIDNFSRIGVRYINLLKEDNILDLINISINAPNSQDFTDEQILGFVYKNDSMLTRVNFATTATLTSGAGTILNGSVLDIDSYIEQTIDSSEALSLIDKGHNYTELAFRGILKSEFLEELQ